MMRRRQICKEAVAASFMVSALLLSGCGMMPLPDNQRYQRINDVLDAIDYETAGEIVTSRKDRGDGVFSPSFIQIGYHGSGAFETLDTRLRYQESIVCNQTFTTQISCKSGQVDIVVMKEETYTSQVFLQVSDRFNGREAK